MKQHGPTAAQAAAINERSKTLLVAAAAGSGKTWTLTERIIEILLSEDAPTELSELLIVTFTTAAAAELRERIAKALREALIKNPENERLTRQLLSLSSANIYTIDAFCNEIVRRNTAAVGLAPGYRVPDTAEVYLLASSVMESLIEGLYAAELPESGISGEDFAALADCLTDVRSDAALTETLLHLYRKTDSEEEGVEALRPLCDAYRLTSEDAVNAHPYVTYMLRQVREVAAEYSDAMRSLSERLIDDPRATAPYSKLFSTLLPLLTSLQDASSYRAVHEQLSAFSWPRLPSLAQKSEIALAIDARYTALRSELKHLHNTFFLYTEAELITLFAELHKKMQTLVCTLSAFDRMYRAEKRRLGLCEYADMERYAYMCLWKDGRRTDIAEALRAQFKGVYIDEYQDVNRLQDRIFEAISNDTNRFMVGDIKQSIYGFRSADPEVFADMKRSFAHLSEAADASQAAIYMSENFRCDRAVIDTVNELFDTLFGAVGASIGYLPEDRLICAKDQDGVPYRTSELLLTERQSDDAEESESEEQDEQAPLKSAESEAHTVAARIRELLANGIKNDGTPVQARDVAVLFRAAKTNIPVFSQVFADYGIPCHIAESCDFFLNADVLLTLCLLNAIDNPSKDIYLTGLLCSPLFGFTPDELVHVRRADESGTLYRALVAYTEATGNEKCRSCLRTLDRYRKIAEGMPMDALLFRLYRETGLLSLATQHGGRDNLLLLYDYARNFERSSFRGLYAFISYVNRLIENRTSFERPSEGAADCNAVRMMSVHASKGLEFPYVFVCGCASAFRNRDGMGSLLYARGFGVSLRLRDAHGLTFVENPVHAAVASRLYETMLEEELRILYVAMTRAREQLFLSGYVGKSAVAFEKKVSERAPRLNAYGVRRLRSYMELLSAAVQSTAVRCTVAPDGVPDTVAIRTEPTAPPSAQDEALQQTLTERFAYRYPRAHLCTLPEKLSVSVLSPSVLDGTEDTVRLSLDGEEPLVLTDGDTQEKSTQLPSFYTGIPQDNSAERGIITHTFMQFCDFDRLATEGVEAELDRLIRQRFLPEDARTLVRLDELEAFRESKLLADIRTAVHVYREFRFHTHLPAAAFTENEQLRERLGDTQLFVQGVMDCVYEDGRGELHLIDYKTDRVRDRSDLDRTREELRCKHTRQLSYYAKASEKIFGRAPKTVSVYSLALGECIKI